MNTNEADKFLVSYHIQDGNGKEETVISWAENNLESAKEKLLASQLAPNSFYSAHEDIGRMSPHYITVTDIESGEIVVGSGRDIKITTLGALSFKNSEKIPNGHIYLFEDVNKSAIFHIDKREFENMVNTIFSAETGYEYSQFKVKKMKHIMESRFYNNLREGLEDDLTERLSRVIISELGSSFINDTMFEDTRRHLLPYFMEKFHRKEVSKFSFVNHDNKNGLLNAVKQLDAMCTKIEGHPPKFFTKEWIKSMLASVDTTIQKLKENGVAIDPIRYTSEAADETGSPSNEQAYRNTLSTTLRP